VRLLGLELSSPALTGILIAVIIVVVTVMVFTTNMLAMIIKWSDAGGVAEILKAIFK
jgi:cell division protein FtsN